MAGSRLQPAKTVRDSGIKAIVLMDAQIDHTTGLFMLRESSGPLTIHSTKEVREICQQEIQSLMFWIFIAR